MYFVPFRSAPAAKVLEPITHNPENINAPTEKNSDEGHFEKKTLPPQPQPHHKLGFYIKKTITQKSIT